MHITMVASECAPVAKVGGLADVVAGLGRELGELGHQTDILLPKYDCMRYDQIWDLQVAWQALQVPWGGQDIPCTVYSGWVHDLNCYFIEPHSPDSWFQRCGYYGFSDDHLRFAFFCKAVLEFLLATGRRPDVIHTHDWQTGLLPVMLHEIYRDRGLEHPRVCHTVHNFRHQGVIGDEVLSAARLDRSGYYHHPDRLQDPFNPSALNLTVGALNYADFINTVSPRHSWEVRFTDQGFGLDHVLYHHQSRFGGILNGLDYSRWNPETDSLIPHHYSSADFEPKYANKRALRDRLLLADEYKPILAYVGRLDAQKGMHLIRHALFFALEHGAQFVLLGVGAEEGINREFWELKHRINDNPDCHIELAFDEELAHLIYAGADILVMPSLFEPCGLTQMIALRYGTVPVVRAVGGLADTVFDRDHSSRPPAERNGYVFNDPDFVGIESALHRVIGLWYSFPGEFRQLALQGMQWDFSWHRPARDYLDIYDYVRQKQPVPGTGGSRPARE